MTELLITVNSPGEVATWLAPVVRAWRATQVSDVKITVFILPCTYASGTEEDVVRRIPGVDQVVNPAGAWRYILGRAVRSHPPARRRLLLFLGGEFSLAARLARRFGCPAVAYTEGYINSAKHFQHVYVPTEEAKTKVSRRGVPLDRVHVVGNLMVDAAAQMDLGEPGGAPGGSPGDGAQGPLVTLFPGSRPAEVRRMVPLFLQSALDLADKQENVRYLLAMSPFVADHWIDSVLHELAEHGIKVETDTETEGRHGLFWRVSQGGEGSGDSSGSRGSRPITVGIVRKRSNEFLATTDLALTIPGSNTAELAVWGVPMVVCLPLQHMVEIPLDGVAGLVDRIPLVGKKLKTWAVRKIARSTQFTSLPNRLTGRFIVPELKSEQLFPKTIADCAFSLLQDERARRRMAEELKSVFGPPGAARHIVHQIAAQLGAVEPSSS